MLVSGECICIVVALSMRKLGSTSEFFCSQKQEALPKIIGVRFFYDYYSGRNDLSHYLWRGFHTSQVVQFFFFPMNRWFLGPCLQYFLWGDDPIWQIFLDPVDATTPHYNSGQLVFEKNPFWFTLPCFPVRWCLRKMAQLHRSFPFRRTEEPRPALQIHRGLKVKP